MDADVNSLLNSVSGLGLEIKRRREFNVFDLCKIGSRETTHTAILASLLDPNGAHNLGLIPLRLFLKRCGLTGINESNLKSAVVESEKTILDGYRRPDIIITGDDFVVVIENKTITGDSKGQLDDYYKWLDSLENDKYENKLLLYLTRKGWAAVNASKSTKYQTLSYEYDIIDWLKQCARSTNAEEVRIALEQYKKFIEFLIRTPAMEITDSHYDAIVKDFKTAALIASKLELAKAKWIWDNIINKLPDNFKADAEKWEDIVRPHGLDCFITYTGDAAKVVYWFGAYGFNVPKVTLRYRDKKEDIVIVGHTPHDWNNTIFRDLDESNAKSKAENAIKSIVSDALSIIAEFTTSHKI